MTSDVIINIALNSGDDTKTGSYRAALGFGASTGPAPMQLNELHMSLEGQAVLTSGTPMPLEIIQANNANASSPPPLNLNQLSGTDVDINNAPRPSEFGINLAASESHSLTAPAPQLQLPQNTVGNGSLPRPTDLGKLAGLGDFDEQPPIFRTSEMSSSANTAPRPENLISSGAGANASPEPVDLAVLGAAGEAAKPESKRPTRS